MIERRLSYLAPRVLIRAVRGDLGALPESGPTNDQRHAPGPRKITVLVHDGWNNVSNRPAALLGHLGWRLLSTLLRSATGGHAQDRSTNSRAKGHSSPFLDCSQMVAASPGSGCSDPEAGCRRNLARVVTVQRA